MLQAAKNAEEKSKCAMVDAARLADELRAEQDHCNSNTSAKNALSSQLSDLENRLADAEAAAMKGGKAAMAKMENKIRELELELANTQTRSSETYKAHQRGERKVKELSFQAEEIAALNLAKFRKAQQELEETEERSKLAAARL